MPRWAEVALQVDAHDGIPLLFRGAHQHAVTQEAGVVHHDVEPAERVDGRADQALGAVPVGHVVAVDDRLATHGPDGIDHLTGRAVGAARAVSGADVVDHDLGAVPGELQGMTAPDAAPSTGDHHHASLADSAHAESRTHSIFVRQTLFRFPSTAGRIVRRRAANHPHHPPRLHWQLARRPRPWRRAQQPAPTTTVSTSSTTTSSTVPTSTTAAPSLPPHPRRRLHPRRPTAPPAPPLTTTEGASTAPKVRGVGDSVFYSAQSKVVARLQPEYRPRFRSALGATIAEMTRRRAR